MSHSPIDSARIKGSVPTLHPPQMRSCFNALLIVTGQDARYVEIAL